MKQSLIPKRYWLVFGTFLLSVLLYVDRACISSAKDDVVSSLHLSDKQFGWIVSAFALGYALFQVPSGMIADRFGPRVLLTSVVTLWSVFTGLTGVAWNYLSLMIFRFLFGADEAGAFPGIARACFSWIPMKERGLVTGINFSGSRVGAALAMPLVAWMIQYFASNFTFFFCLTWALPYLKKTYQLELVQAGFLAAAPFMAGAADKCFENNHLHLCSRAFTTPQGYSISFMNKN